MKSLKSFFKKNVYTNCLRLISLISPTLNTKIVYFVAFKKKLNLESPKTLKEKLLVLKLKRYCTDPLVVQCADKYAVREYIKANKCDDILIPLIATYDNANEIVWEKLPNSFVIKWNFGCGFNIICPNKEQVDVKQTIKKLNKWKKDKSYLTVSEMQYHRAEKKIIIEKYLKPSNGELPADYKVYCFHGTPKAILYIDDRGTENIMASFYDTNWNYLGDTGKSVYKKSHKEIPAPACLSKMINVSQILSKPFEFVRMDFYVIDDKLYFGEMTFTPAGCFGVSECKVHGETMGNFLDVSKYTQQ